MTIAVPEGFLWSRPACNQSVTEGPWGSAVNWVKAQRLVSANMTQYRVDARNCEAKSLHIGPYVACGFAHVCPARQWFAKSALGVRRRSARRPVPAHAGVQWPYYGKLRSN